MADSFNLSNNWSLVHVEISLVLQSKSKRGEEMSVGKVDEILNKVNNDILMLLSNLFDLKQGKYVVDETVLRLISTLLDIRKRMKAE